MIFWYIDPAIEIHERIEPEIYTTAEIHDENVSAGHDYQHYLKNLSCWPQSIF